jgi:cytochrome c5
VRSLFLVASVCAVAIALYPAPQQSAGPANAPAAMPPAAERALLDKYCVTCHNEKAKTAGLMLDKMDVNHIGDGAETWEKVVRKIHGGTMPPQGMPRPDQASLDNLSSSLENSLDRAAISRPEPGHAGMHRLNRIEYGNAIRDLLDLKVDVTQMLPADDESNGFDNIADVLKVSPSLLEQYLTASRTVASVAVGDKGLGPVSQVYQVPPSLAQAEHIEGLPLGTRGGILIKQNFPLDGEYEFSVFLLRNIVGYMTGLEYPHQFEITVDGTRVFLSHVGGEEDNKMMDTNLGLAGNTIDARLRTRAVVKAGPHEIGVTFVARNHSESVEPLQPFTRNLDLQDMNGLPLIDHVQVTGPFAAKGPGDTPSRRRIFACHPANENEELPCAKKVLSTLARRAYRRPVSDADMETLLSFYQKGRNKGSFDAGIETALRLILTDPKFLYRTEPDPANAAPGSINRVTDLELASRLSFFLWSSIPDDELLDVAAKGKLKDSTILRQQVRRMLADPKAEALVTNFASEWLFLRNLQSVNPASEDFPNFDENLKQAFRQETEMFVGSVFREDRNVLDLLTADYTFVNERLAKHYGIPNIYGSQFRRVPVASDARRGLLGQGSILTVTSYPTRTSPVLRGKWILENVMGTPPPAPPPNVPALKESDEGGKVTTVRERLEEHRKNPACATCHRVMDPLGFSLDNFDAVGAWRTKENGLPLDSSGQLADGTKISGVVDLRAALMKHPERFVGTMTEKMMTYALGRGLEYYDMPVVRGIVRESAKDDYRFSSIVMGIVNTTAFQMKRAKEAETAPVNTAQLR